jgi:hypothetical protein
MDDARRRAHDTRDWRVVLAVLAMLGLYLYLFTHAGDFLSLPRPEALAQQLGLHLDHVFDQSRNVSSNVTITMTQRYASNDDERMVFLLVLVAAFLSAYFLPLAYKQPSMIFWTGVAVWLLYGSHVMAALLAAQLVVYLVLHPRRQHFLLYTAALGLAFHWAFLWELTTGPATLAVAAVAVLAVSALYRFLLLPLLARERAARVLRTLAVQSAMVTVTAGAVIEFLTGSSWSLPLGILLFFWQWERLILYHVDYKDGQVPRELPLVKFLAVFWNPALVPNWNWGVTIGQGYSYVHNNFLAEDKNRLVMAGVRLLAVALLYLVFWNWGRHLVVEFFEGQGIRVFNAYTRNMVRHFVAGGEVSSGSVLATTFLDLARWTVLWAGVVHFKAAIWRILGFRMDPYMNRPWLATDLATFWSRFTYHYREFLVRAFYYPAFFRWFRKRPYLRILVATMAAAGFGNLVWGHMTERLFYRGLEMENALYVLGTWPYFVLLGLGIAFSQIFLLGRKRRKPWSRDAWLVKDVLAVYLTLQYFALIHIFARPVPGSSLGDLFRLFMKAFGVEIPA